jgi:hypothetical protein
MRRENKQKFKKILNVPYFISVSCDLDKDFLPVKQSDIATTLYLVY